MTVAGKTTTRRREERGWLAVNRGFYKNYPQAPRALASVDWIERIRLSSRELSTRNTAPSPDAPFNNDPFVATRATITNAGIAIARPILGRGRGRG